jgi:hypothetical protein
VLKLVTIEGQTGAVVYRDGHTQTDKIATCAKTAQVDADGSPVN